MGKEIVEEAGRESQEIMEGQVDTWKNQSLGAEGGEHLKLERGEQTPSQVPQPTLRSGLGDGTPPEGIIFFGGL